MFIRKMSKLVLITALVFAVCAPAAIAAEGAPEEQAALTVGGESFNSYEILQLISDFSGNEMMAMLMLSQATLESRHETVKDISEAVLFAAAAKGEKLHERPDLAFQIRWQTMQILMQAYFEKLSEKWDLSEAAVQKYYKDHRADFVRGEAVSAAHILTETESEALMMALRARAGENFAELAAEYSRDPNTAPHGGDLGWVEKGAMVPEVEAPIMKGRPGDIVGPVKSGYGWHVLKIAERRPAVQLTFEEAANEVVRAMQTDYIEQDLVKLREKYPVKINDEALKTLGGIPAREPEAESAPAE